MTPRTADLTSSPSQTQQEKRDFPLASGRATLAPSASHTLGFCLVRHFGWGDGGNQLGLLSRTEKRQTGPSKTHAWITGGEFPKGNVESPFHGKKSKAGFVSVKANYTAKLAGCPFSTNERIYPGVFQMSLLGQWFFFFCTLLSHLFHALRLWVLFIDKIHEAEDSGWIVNIIQIGNIIM